MEGSSQDQNTTTPETTPQGQSVGNTTGTSGEPTQNDTGTGNSPVPTTDSTTPTGGGDFSVASDNGAEQTPTVSTSPVPFTTTGVQPAPVIPVISNSSEFPTPTPSGQRISDSSTAIGAGRIPPTPAGRRFFRRAQQNALPSSRPFYRRLRPGHYIGAVVVIALLGTFALARPAHAPTTNQTTPVASQSATASPSATLTATPSATIVPTVTPTIAPPTPTK